MSKPSECYACTISNKQDLHCAVHDIIPPDDPPPCNHSWVHINASFDHAFGTEPIHYWECSRCGETTSKNPLPDLT